MLKRLLTSRTVGDFLNLSHGGEVLPANNATAQQAVVDMSWVEDCISKMRTICDQIAKKHQLPPQSIGLDGREFYGYLFNSQTTDKCPICGHEFGKYLQRATTCPKCHKYLRVRYGYLLSDEDEKRARDVQFLGNSIWRYKEIEPEQLRMLARHGMDDTIRQVINEFSEKMSPYL